MVSSIYVMFATCESIREVAIFEKTKKNFTLAILPSKLYLCYFANLKETGAREPRGRASSPHLDLL